MIYIKIHFVWGIVLIIGKVLCQAVSYLNCYINPKVVTSTQAVTFAVNSRLSFLDLRYTVYVYWNKQTVCDKIIEDKCKNNSDLLDGNLSRISESFSYHIIAQARLPRIPNKEIPKKISVRGLAIPYMSNITIFGVQNGTRCVLVFVLNLKVN